MLQFKVRAKHHAWPIMGESWVAQSPTSHFFLSSLFFPNSVCFLMHDLPGNNENNTCLFKSEEKKDTIAISLISCGENIWGQCRRHRQYGQAFKHATMPPMQACKHTMWILHCVRWLKTTEPSLVKVNCSRLVCLPPPPLPLLISLSPSLYVSLFSPALTLFSHPQPNDMQSYSPPLCFFLFSFFCIYTHTQTSGSRTTWPRWHHTCLAVAVVVVCSPCGDGSLIHPWLNI